MRYLLPEASVALSPGVAVEDGYLRDIDGRRYPLNRVGFMVCSIATVPVDLRIVIDEISELLSEPSESFELAIRTFVVDLHARGLMSIHQSFWTEAVDSLVLTAGSVRQSPKNIFDIFRGDFFFRRYPATTRGVLRACLEAHQLQTWLGVIVLVISLIAAVAGNQSVQSIYFVVRMALVGVSFYFLAFFSAIYVHELGHLWAAKFTKSILYGTYAAPGMAGLSFKASTPLRSLIVFACGPTTSLIYLGAVEFAIVFSPNQFWNAGGIAAIRLALGGAVLVTAIWQIFGFLPLTGDGRRIFGSLRELMFHTKPKGP